MKARQAQGALTREMTTQLCSHNVTCGPACIDIRFGHLTDQRVNKRRDSDATERKLLALNQDEDNMPCSQNEADDNRQSATTPNEEDNIPSVSVVNPLLAYMLFALKSGTPTFH